MAMLSRPRLWRGALLALALLAASGLPGCGNDAPRTGNPTIDPRDRVRPNVYPALQDTIGEVAALGTGRPLQVNGVGVVAELPNTGSGEMPPPIRAILLDQLRRYGGSWTLGTETIRPELILSSPRIAAVQVYGSIPPMATKYSHFDLTIVAMPGTQTTSLEHGVLWTADLKVIGVAQSEWTTRTLAVARGPIYVQRAAAATQPATSPATQSAAGKLNLRRGMVIGGGMVIEDMPVVLQLYSPSDRFSALIQRVINARFPARPPYAAAQNENTIALRIPPEYQDRPQEFLDLVLHMYLGQEVPGFVDKKARELIAALSDPKAPHRQIGLALQGLGRPIIEDHLRAAYASPNPTVRFYAAKAGAAMQDVQAMVILEDFANAAGSPYQYQAIAAIGDTGRNGDTERATVALMRLLNTTNTKLRIAAYEALRQTGSPVVRSYWVPKKFQMDIVPSDGPSMIYATQSKAPRIALIGRDFTLAPGTLYVSPDNMLTVNVGPGAEHADAGAIAPEPKPATDAMPVSPRPTQDSVTLYYRGAAGDKAVTLKAPPYLPVLLARLAYTPNPLDPKTYDPKQPFIGVSYQRVVELLASVCRDRALNATFVLGPAPLPEANIVDLAEGARPEGLILMATPTTAPAPTPSTRPGVPQ